MKRFRIVSKKKEIQRIKEKSDRACWKSSIDEHFDHEIMIKMAYRRFDLERKPKWQIFVIMKKGDDD